MSVQLGKLNGYRPSDREPFMNERQRDILQKEAAVVEG